uniref:Uncharacterized protein n=1 Tax=Candidatus Kentrum sp. FW TaxID=2126338 RepID=A0A450SQ62_9GAMM|nr:MAG: hypothetical protein BECKFW1821A_GA0114235_101439 [Candidatus Kentron sp. FW]VFJ56139.1 MAG: hypothetical protein BECKFW1821B_GA0114236_10263 [Candidatus Kentron sp. FW]
MLLGTGGIKEQTGHVDRFIAPQECEKRLGWLGSGVASPRMLFHDNENFELGKPDRSPFFIVRGRTFDPISRYRISGYQSVVDFLRSSGRYKAPSQRLRRF